MSERMSTMSDDELDQTIVRYLGWRAHQTHGAPDASTVAARLVGQRPAADSRARRVVVLVLAGLLVAAAVGVASLVGRPSTLPGPLARTSIYLVDGLGWHELDPATRELTTVTAPCDGLCPTGTFFTPSSDGQSVFYVETTRIGGDLRPEPPGWSLWRWDRDATVVSQVAACTEPCRIDVPTPSPDGRWIAYVESPGGTPEAGGTVVVIDALTGESHWRQARAGFAVPAWDARGRLILSSIEAPDDTTTSFERIDLGTGRSEEVGADLPDIVGVIVSSPDGQRAVILETDMPNRAVIRLLDPDLEGARVVFDVEAPSLWQSRTWSPDGTRLLTIVRDSTTQTSDLTQADLRTYDLSTGDVETLATVPVGRFPLWLPD